MSGAKRLAKRSIIGTRVCALCQQDGRYHPGVIRAVAAEATPVTDDLYTVHFDDGFEANVTSKNIVGQGFQSGPSGRLKHDQKVFITLNGREVSGTVAHHDRRTEEVIITVRQGSKEESTIHCKVDEVRLLESRKSARLVDQATDYSKLADRHRTEHRRRVVSHSIDVPNSAFKQRQRHSSSGDAESNGDNGGDGEDVRMMDETIAAMVLTTLSVSPQSPSYNTQSTGYDSIREHSYVSSSVASSGFYSGQSERGDPSPPHLSESAPPSFDFPGRPELSSDSDTRDSNASGTDKQQGSAGVKYRCTWRGCCSVFETTNGVERHIRRAHLDRDSDIELSDNEEEFYYEEIDEDELLDSVTESFAGMYTSSPPGDGLPMSFDTSSAFDHDYLRKDETQAVCDASSAPSGGTFRLSEMSKATNSIPITIPEGQIKRSLSWQVHGPSSGSLVSPPHRTPKPTPQERLQQHHAQSPKSHMLSMSPIRASGPHRKPRSEVRKCRKVYGMDNRDQWCTQCKWKKACTRFLD
ncbi:zinc finger protein 704-like [Babylonia areolata]|uniref:zinc finger protein 704-like n=1 Tax=Babylonia areolata TaxID=304850 RepID=UPI003FD106B9